MTRKTHPSSVMPSSKMRTMPGCSIWEVARASILQSEAKLREAQLNGGRLWIESGPDAGTTFALALPAAKVPTAAAR